MKMMYLLQGFDVSNFKQFIPDPALMETEGEAAAFCKNHCGEGEIYHYIPVRVGSYQDIPHKIQDDQGIRLYYLEYGRERIPVLTDSLDTIRSDVASEDHGGMDFDVFSDVCVSGEIKQVKGEHDLPADLMNACCYGGGSVGFVDLTCRQLCEYMEDGIITLPDWYE